MNGFYMFIYIFLVFKIKLNLLRGGQRRRKPASTRRFMRVCVDFYLDAFYLFHFKNTENSFKSFLRLFLKCILYVIAAITRKLATIKGIKSMKIPEVMN